MSEGHSTVDVAWDRFLRAEYEERQARRWAPERHPDFMRRRSAAARVLHKMGVDISAMRREKLDAAAAVLAERLATEGVRATVRRAGTVVVAESPDNVDHDSMRGFIEWATSRGVQWSMTSHPLRPGEHASLTFCLVARGQSAFVPEVSAALAASQASTSKKCDESAEKTIRDAEAAAEKALVDAGRAVVGEARYEATRAERRKACIQRLSAAIALSDWEEWSE